MNLIIIVQKAYKENLVNNILLKMYRRNDCVQIEPESENHTLLCEILNWLEGKLWFACFSLHKVSTNQPINLNGWLVDIETIEIYETKFQN